MALPGLPYVFATMGVRIRGIDAAELRGSRCPLEKCLAVDARDKLVAMVVGRNATLERFARRTSASGSSGRPSTGRMLVGNCSGRLRGALQWAGAEARLVRVHRRAGAAVRGGARGPVRSRSFLLVCLYA